MDTNEPLRRRLRPSDGPVDFQIDVRREGADVILALSGELDIASAPLLRTELFRVLDEGAYERVLVDLDDVDMLDSTGLGVLVAGVKRAQPDGARIELLCSKSRTIRIFRALRFDRVFPIHADLSETRIRA
jgi:anti-sigma B factor antagonist